MIASAAVVAFRVSASPARFNLVKPSPTSPRSNPIVPRGGAPLAESEPPTAKPARGLHKPHRTAVMPPAILREPTRPSRGPLADQRTDHLPMHDRRLS